LFEHVFDKLVGMFDSWDDQDDGPGGCLPGPEVVPAVPDYLAARDAAWCPDDDAAVGLPDEVYGDDLGDGVDPGVWRDLVSAVDGGSWLVVPDEGVPVVMVADGRGRRYPAVAGVTPGADLADALERLTTAATATVTGSGFPSGVSLSGVGDVELGEVVGACQRLGSWARAVQAVGTAPRSVDSSGQAARARVLAA